ncbi:ATP-binding protein [Streptomyces sp. NBC_00690]|uniref:ATP-binding protein n=1 Tax=Streptomyces sp. NBC_00690 TaxID=2975808 RepID=UPI002E2C691C|nr:ATP-binding protein [Streptomyces sp. NBC_00690]
MWERPVAGREPAAAALLGWLADPQAPRICVVSGSPGCGKTTLLAWLVRHASQADVPAERAVHAVVPGGTDDVRSVVWAVAEQLGAVARAPGELVAVLAADRRRTVIVLPDVRAAAVAELAVALADLTHLRLVVEASTGSTAHQFLTSGAGVAELDLDLPQWRDEQRYRQWRAAKPHDDAAADATPPVTVDLADPAALCAADPWAVTAACEALSDTDTAEVRAGWIRAGQSLQWDQSPASRALVLLAALGEGADEQVRGVLAALAEGMPWRVEWGRHKGDRTPPWPGPVAALALVVGAVDPCVLAADPFGVVRKVGLDDAKAEGRRGTTGGQLNAICALPDGTVLVLDDVGAVRAHPWGPRPVAGLAALLDEGPTATNALIEALPPVAGTALAWAAGPAAGVVAVGDTEGTVHAVGKAANAVRLHQGRVTALAGIGLPTSNQGTLIPLFYSGGEDGTVRAWAPGSDPMPSPLVRRPFPVVALSAAPAGDGAAVAVAWADGLVQLLLDGPVPVREFRPGAPVRALTLAADLSLVIGLDESLIRLTPRPAQHEQPSP